MKLILNQAIQSKLRRLDLLRSFLAALGLVLIAGGSLKLYDLADAGREDDLWVLVLIVLSEAELFGGLCLLEGSHLDRKCLWAFAAFLGFWSSSLYKVVSGACTCGCLGGFAVNPWYTLILDLVVVIGLASLLTPETRDALRSSDDARIAGVAFVALIVGIAGVFYQPLVTAKGIATRNGSPLGDTNLVFDAQGHLVEAHTDPSGAFRLPPCKPGLYKVSVVSISKPDHPQDATAKTAIVETPKRTIKQGATNQRVAGKSLRRPAGLPPPEIDATAKWFMLEDNCEDIRINFP